MSLISPANQLYSVAEVVKPDGTKTSQLRLLDTSTGSSSVVSDLAFSTFAITRDELTGRIYYIETGVNGRVAYFDPATQQNTVLEQRTGVNSEFLKLTQTPDNKIYGLESSTNNLYTLDASTGKTQLIGTVEGGAVPFSKGSGDIIADSNNPDRLFAITTGQDFYRLYSIDLTTRKATYIGDAGLIGGHGSGSLAFADDKLLATSQNALYQLDPTTGQATLVGALGYASDDFATVRSKIISPIQEDNTPQTIPPIRDNYAPQTKDVSVEVKSGQTLNIPELVATDSDSGDSIVSYTITSLPSKPQGTLYLGDPKNGGQVIQDGQTLSPEDIDNLFFQSTDAFRGASFTYTATDSRGDSDRTPATVTLDSCGCHEGKNMRGDRRNNRMNGGSNGDSLYGRGGRDMIRGGDCQDDIDGGRGKDRLKGGHDSDIVQGRRNRDQINGGAGDDRVSGNVGNDRVWGGRGNDDVWGGRGNDIGRGGDGNDLVRGGRAKDRLFGGGGNDTVFGNIGKDSVSGNRGNDYLDGGRGSDKLFGGRGRDVMNGKSGNDVMSGGKERDRFVYTSLNDGVDRIVDFEAKRDRIDLSQVFDKLGLGKVANPFSFIQVLQVGADTHLQIDANGKKPGFKAQTIQVLENFNASEFSNRSVIV
ncbi:MAG TPA: hypothetical protein V6D10_22435 [Trichocoleus sp.]|jgi:Ca2+-binding RTX toxin-like protein